MAVAAAVSWPLAMTARRMLAARGRTGFDDLPSADFDYDDSALVRFNSQMLDTATVIGVGALAGWLFDLAGAGGGTEWGLPVWLLCGWVAAAPAMWEADARYGLRIRRKRLREEALIEGRVEDRVEEEDEEPGFTPDPEPVPLTDAIVVPIARGRVAAIGALTLAAGIGCVALGLAGSDMDAFGRVAILVSGPVLLFVSTMWFRYLRRPYFLRLASTGADLLGAGEVPWEAIIAADVMSQSLNRWFSLALVDPLGDQPWATRAMKPLARMSKGEDLSAMTRLSAWPADRIAAAVRSTGRVEVHAFLA
jgi:hypothetical protein